MFSLFRRNADSRVESVFKALDRSQAVIEFAPDGTIVTANDNFLRTMGYGLDEVRGRHHRIFVDPYYAKSEAYEAFWDSLRRGEFQSASFKRIAKGGRIVWIQATYNPILNDKGEVERVVKFATDITLPTVKAQEAIDRSQATIAFNLDGTIVEANGAFLKTMGYRLADIVGHHHSMFVDRAYAASGEYHHFWERLRAGEFQAGEFERVGKGGRRVWIKASYNPVFDIAGNPEKIVKYATDITATKAIAAETRQVANEVAAATEHMSTSVNEIARNMASARHTVDNATSAAVAAEQDVSRLLKTADSMGEILEIITAISAQIDLLALNARVEAARAGDAGRGFAVVADEVKKLSARTTESTRRIEDDIRSVQNLADQMGKALKQVASLMKTVSAGTGDVATATEQQASAVSRIADQVGQLNGLIANTN